MFLDLKSQRFVIFGCFAIATSIAIGGCGAQPGVSNANLANAGTNRVNSNAIVTTGNVTNVNNSNSLATATVESREPDQYQATVTLKIEGTGGGKQTMALPTLAANVARSGTDRRMEFTMPAGGRIVFLEKAGTNYVIMPEKKQFAELNRESLGFEVRRMMMPDQMVAQVKSMAGMELVGDEKYNGRDAVKYRYAAVANTSTQAGTVATESFLIIDKATGLPLHTETRSQTQGGANVRGFSGLRVITEITDIKTELPNDFFMLPEGLQKIESGQVRSQVNLIFNSVAVVIGELLRQSQSQGIPAR